MESYLINKLSKMIKIEGFEKKGYTWISKSNDFYYVIDLQPSSGNVKGEESFAVNIGVFSEKAYYLCWGKNRNSIKITDCCFQGRIADFINIGSSWYSIKGTDDIEKVKNELTWILQKQIVPFLKDIKTYNDLSVVMTKYSNKMLQKELHQIYLSCIEYILGEKEKNFKLLADIITQKTVWANKAMEVEKRIKSL